MKQKVKHSGYKQNVIKVQADIIIFIDIKQRYKDYKKP